MESLSGDVLEVLNFLISAYLCFLILYNEHVLPL
jgi:hypothetical protein